MGGIGVVEGGGRDGVLGSGDIGFSDKWNGGRGGYDWGFYSCFITFQWRDSDAS